MSRHLIYVQETEASVGKWCGPAEDDAVEKAVANLIATHEEQFYDLVNAAQAELQQQREIDGAEYAMEDR